MSAASAAMGRSDVSVMPGDDVALEHERAALGVEHQVDAAHVSAAQRDVHGARDVAHGPSAASGVMRAGAKKSASPGVMRAEKS